MSEKTKRRSWDHEVGMVLAVLGGFLLLVKFKVHAIVLSLWPVALIFLGWQMYRKADEQNPRRRAGAPPPVSPGDLDEDENEFED